MPMPPDFQDIAATWMDDTSLFWSTGRSEDLQSVDRMLATYQAHKTPCNLEALGRMLDAWLLRKGLDAWMAGKLRPAGGAPPTRRDAGGAVTRLRQRVENALMPVPLMLWDASYPGIYIADDLYRGTHWVPDDFAAAIGSMLSRIEGGGPVGRAFLTNLSNGCETRQKKVVIEWADVKILAAPLEVLTPETRKTIQPTWPNEPKVDVDKLLKNPAIVVKKNYVPGGGANAVVCFKHDDQGPHFARRPPFIGLAHELIHALHYVEGACYRAPCGGLVSGKNTGQMEEEMRTTGVGPYSDETPSENAIRVEHHLPRRETYDPAYNWDAVQVTGPAWMYAELAAL